MSSCLLSQEKNPGKRLKRRPFRLDGAWASFVDIDPPPRGLLKTISYGARSTTTSILNSLSAPPGHRSDGSNQTFGDEELVAASGYGPVHALDSALRKVLEKHYPRLAEMYLEEFDVQFCTSRATLKRAAPAPWSESWRFFPTVPDDGLEWKLRGERKH